MNLERGFHRLALAVSLGLLGAGLVVVAFFLVSTSSCSPDELLRDEPAIGCLVQLVRTGAPGSFSTFVKVLGLVMVHVLAISVAPVGAVLRGALDRPRVFELSARRRPGGADVP